jgi:integrase/recombinase XerC
MYLTEHVERLRAAGQSPKTIEARIAVITRFSVSLGSDPSHATTQQLATWLARSGWSRGTRQIYRYHLRAYYGWLAAAGLIPADPSEPLLRIRAPHGPPRPVTDAVLSEILARARDPYLRYFVLAAYAGLRCQEVVTLEREDVDQDRLLVRGKGDKVRLVPTHPLVWQHIGGLPLGPIYHLGPYAPHVAAHKLSCHASQVLTRLGHQQVTMHRLRHWFGSRTYQLTRNLRATQELLGHSSVATTQRYTQVSDEERRLAVNALPATLAA